MPRGANDYQELQRQIEELSELVEAQNRQVEEANQQIAVLQAAAAAGPAALPALAVGVPQQQAVNVPNNRIPDLIRIIPEFNGNPKNLPRWIQSVEEKLDESGNLLTVEEKQRVMPIWMGIIRDKITEKANDALSASHTPLEWQAIKTTLTEYFGDKRDLSSLVSKMTNLNQGNQSVSEFYYECRSLLADINAKILINETREHAKAIMGTYETLMINAFIDGLRDLMSSLVRISRPQTLTDAYQTAAEQESAMRRRREKTNFKPSSPSNFNTSQNARSNPNFSVQNPRPNPNSFYQYPRPNPNSYQNPRPNPNSPNQNQSQGSYQRPQTLQNNSKPLAIKQEPRSQTGLRQNTNNFRPNTHEHYYALPPGILPYQFPPYPPYLNAYPAEVHSNSYYPQNNEKPEENGELVTSDENQEDMNPQLDEENITDELNFLVAPGSNEQT